MSAKSIVGIEKIEMGDCGADGAMGLTLAEHVLIERDSVLLKMDEPGKTDLYVEGSDSPFMVIPDPNRVRALEFALRDMEAATLEKLFGGTVATDTWSAPASEALIEQSVKVTTKAVSGYYREISIPRALIRASMNAPLKSNETATVKVVCDILTPFDGSGTALSPIQIAKVSET